MLILKMNFCDADKPWVSTVSSTLSPSVTVTSCNDFINPGWPSEYDDFLCEPGGLGFTFGGDSFTGSFFGGASFCGTEKK